MFGYSAIQFKFNGDSAPSQVLNYSDPAYGLLYSRSNLAGSIFWGRQQAPDTTARDLSLLDFNLAFWGEVFFSEAATSANHRVFLPIMIFSNYRKVSPSGIDVLEEFNITTLGIGLGLGYYGAWGDLALLEFRSTPSIGYAARSFGDSAGLARLLDTDVQFHLGEVFGKLGLSLGYNYRITIWDVKTTNVFGAIDDDFFKYRDDRHSFHLGLNW
jgi:hypothetical protein